MAKAGYCLINEVMFAAVPILYTWVCYCSKPLFVALSLMPSVRSIKSKTIKLFDFFPLIR